MVSLSHDIIPDVLCRLGVKDLLRFRCVSKPFCSLIDGPCFIKHHLSHSLETIGKNPSLFVLSRNRVDGPFRISIFSVDFGSLQTSLQLNKPVYESDEMQYTDVVGSCHGLLALYNGETELCLWNPSTRESKLLAFTGVDLGDSPRRVVVTFGFGYDPISDDYKLVHITQFPSFKSEVKVYSLRCNSWRRIQDFPFYLQTIRGVLANSALHWVVSKEPGPLAQGLVVALDLETEEYRLVELPDHISVDLNITALEGRLCLIANYWTPIVVIDIWIMKEYEVKESWTRLISMKPPESIWIFDVLPLAFPKNGDKVLLWINGHKLEWYDITSERVDKVSIEDLSRISEFEMFVDSLVPLNGAMVQ